MAIFRVTVDSILIREAGEDGDDGDAEWTVFFNSPRGAVADVVETGAA
jgi:hypothetical protein